jgi:hypothetical protein
MEHGEPKREVVYNEDNENKMEDEDVYNEYMEQLLHLNTIPSVDDVVDINELISLIRSKNIMTEECLRKFGTLLELGGFEDDAAIKSKLFQLDFIIDSNESDDVIKKYFVVLLDNMYRFLSISIEKNRESLNLIEDLRRKIV